jgi:hypothetical protein
VGVHEARNEREASPIDHVVARLGVDARADRRDDPSLAAKGDRGAVERRADDGEWTRGACR